MKNTYRFTLVELLAVMALIAILSAIGFGGYSYAKGKAKESATEALLKQVEAGLESFHTKNGYYPRSNGGDFQNITIALGSDGMVESIGFGYDKAQNHDKKNIDYTLTRNASPSSKKERMENERLESFTKAVDAEVLKGSLDSDGVLLDAWGNKIYYRSPGLFKTGSYDLVSAGPDGVFSQKKTEKPTNSTTSDGGRRKDFREDDGERVCDDIFNF